MSDIKEQVLSEIKKVDEHIEKLENRAAEQEKNNGEAHQEVKEQLTKMSETYTQLKERLDSVETEAKRLGKGAQESKSFKDALSDAFNDGIDKLKAMSEGQTKSVSFDIKDGVGTMTQGDNLTGEVIPPTRVPGIFHDPDRQQHVRQFLSTATTDSNNIRYVVEDDYEDGTDVVGEGSTKPQSDFELEAKDAPVRKIATYMKVSDEMLEDVAGLSGFITARGSNKYRLKEDQQLLYGTGSGNQIKGLTLDAASFDGKLTEPRKNEFDVIMDARAQLADRHYMPEGVMVHPVDWMNLLIRKGTDGQYIVPDIVRNGLAPAQIAGVPVIQNTAINEGEFLIADFSQMATLYDRRGLSVRFFEQNEDDAIKNLITVVIEGRLALPIYLPNAGVHGEFSDYIES